MTIDAYSTAGQLADIERMARGCGLMVTKTDWIEMERSGASLCERVLLADGNGTAVSILCALPGVFVGYLRDRPVISVAVSGDGGKTFKEVARCISVEQARRMVADAFDLETA